MVRRLIDQNPRREQRRQVLLMQRIERPLEQRLRAEIARAMREMAERFAITGETLAPRDHVENLTAIYQAMAIATITAFGIRILDVGMAKAAPYTFDNGKTFAFARGSGVRVETKDFAATMTRLALGYINSEMMRQRITNVADTTRSQIVSAVARGYDDGLGQVGVAGYIRDLIPSISGYRAGMIARTETHGAANYGSISAAAETGLRLRKEWISAEDERTRVSHADANGQIVEQADAFDVGGEALMYPGDPGGAAAEVINCRCTTGFIVDD
jgi:hypothetical protein